MSYLFCDDDVGNMIKTKDENKVNIPNCEHLADTQKLIPAEVTNKTYSYKEVTPVCGDITTNVSLSPKKVSWSDIVNTNDKNNAIQHLPDMSRKLI